MFEEDYSMSYVTSMLTIEHTRQKGFVVENDLSSTAGVKMICSGQSTAQLRLSKLQPEENVTAPSLSTPLSKK